ncbi:HAMP domain-containing sensor histidine kinase [Teredinibacter sp. KSP-S5-2]|uniref:sensor histidine kinase n=1 Tax=Teredinibacter sp. KSP-S5-2 TaxID=3034506 RepID=UPI002934CDFF|nr:HAMP domain-containing sensor histidine kinase [Teredinibacter sp. KSP-S5-2]WNO11156.1 HAMP domain-containing sensor histidine kinase [Teredinibacter sp. KSP-S5-2]
MNISKSLRFRINAGYVIFCLVTTVCYSICALTVLKISDDELFNWYIVRLAEGLYNQHDLLHQTDFYIADSEMFVGTDAQVIRKVLAEHDNHENTISDSMSLDDWDHVRHVSRGDSGRYEVYELTLPDKNYHMVKIPLRDSFNKNQFFYYIIDVSGYNTYAVSAVQGTYFGLSVLLFLFFIIAIVSGKVISEKVISPLKQLADEVAKADVGTKLNSYYPDEVGILAGKVNQLVARIGGFIDREKAFSRDVSHELRTPITSSQVSLELAMQMTKESDTKLRSVLQRIGDANRDMIHLIETFMLIGRENIPKDSVTQTNLYDVVHESITRNQYLIGVKKLDVVSHVDEKIEVKQPKKLLLVVIDNILRNAFQYTDEGNVTIRGNKEFISIADTGRGFDQSAIDRLSMPYETFHGEGVGLGLNIIKRICKLTGWRLDVRSECGVGSLLIIHF